MSIAIDPQDIKKEKILESAYNRFLHYGYSKTTMNEIAGDVSMSKALLYYYFPDKSQLYVAVMQKLANDHLKVIKSGTDFPSLEEAFITQLTNKNEFILKNYNFFDFFRLNEQNLPDAIWEIIGQLHEAEIEQLSNCITNEVKKGVIKPVDDPKAIVDLLLDALHGVRVRSFSQKKIHFPKLDQMEEIHQKRLLLVKIFVKGLMN
ncbi:TetR/AcrR family transcriptional regulator [Mucilaginibacter sp. HMF5004]|uniref:TetR/AcrR family transcriptional regulator n=1 Tax=Mucilaginibacter rivuli TaxID=2857527 RepID=UPI001C5DE7C5|nr:TetR/AcrR family transcriptional regulator [Mucilaginibacter rivuli]MBW4890576.1 TetR/AcrR family transcriptional regulator [Mucilaginibacter rivuli]